MLRLGSVSVLAAVGLLVVILAAYLTSRVPPTELHVSNVIVMISDGCGYNQVAATDLYEAGVSGSQVYERFPYQYGMSTYALGGGYSPKKAWRDFSYVQEDATDSAAAATAMSTGRKTKWGALGVDRAGRQLIHVLERAEEQGLATGVVTSVMLSHATPAGFSVHNPSREDYRGIANEMLLDSALDVVMGCGHPFFDDNGHPTEEAGDFTYVGGRTTWDALKAGLAGADADGDGDPDPWRLVEAKGDFADLMDSETSARVCGVPQVRSTLQQRRSGEPHASPGKVPMTATVPTLAEMTRGALNVLDDYPNGLVLLVEGGAVDWACHANQTGRMIEEQMDFNEAVEVAVRWVEENSSWSETLLVVTSDHECGYLCGPGSDPGWEDIEDRGAGTAPGVEWHSTNHTNSLVPLYACGDGGKLLAEYADETDPVRGAYIDNTELAKVIFRLLDQTRSVSGRRHAAGKP